MRFGLLLSAGIILSLSMMLKAQQAPVSPSRISTGTFLGETPPLRDLPRLTPDEVNAMRIKAEKKLLNKKLRDRSYPFSETAQPKGPDQVWQKIMGANGNPKAPLVNFDGQTSPYYPPDCNGTAGPNHYMQTVNCTYAIYNKTGTLVAGPTDMNLLFSGVTGSTYNDGDPIVLFDEQSQRYVATEFSISGSNDYMMIAVSSTNDPTGTWYKYSFDVADMPDYPKFGVWQDGYYMGDNNSSGNDIYVFQRSVMLTGGTSPQMVGFNNPFRPTSIDGFMCVPPVDNDGVAAPAGAPGMFIAFNDDAIGGGADELWIYELAVNWTTPSASTFNRVQQLAVAPFDSNFGNDWTNIAQPGTTQQLDAIPQVIMNVPQYRNFGTYQALVCCHSVDVDNTDHAGVRWYELRRGTQTSGNWAIRQQGTYAPDANSRWMGSIMLNGSGKIGLGYSVSSSTVYPSIRFTGQTSAAYSAASGVMDLPEDVIQTGAYSQTGVERWGDYSQMSVDPSDDQTFWYTDEYIGSGGARKTKIASFKIGNNPAIVTVAATAVTGTSATLNGTVNPNGLSTNYHFEWGTTVSYGNNTPTVSAGSGTSTVPVNASISGLTSGQTYHFRLVGVNSDGTSNGLDLSFTPGAASVTTTAVSGITLTSAISGGNVITDGGSAVTARGVCWGTTANPVATGNHTTDGSGTGTFISNIIGLSSNTTYHVRAYATNSSGTYYGDDLTFTTLCGTYSLPFTESFSGTIIPNCWSQIDHQGNNQVWQFGTITSQSPNPSLTGNYAFLNSDAYGSGNSQNADLISPTIDMTGYTAITIQFNHYFKSYSGSSGTFSYSIDNGTTWTQLQSYNTTSATNPAAYNQVVAALSGQANVKLKWNYTGTWGYSWAIDDVHITGTASGPTLSVTPPNQNVGTSAGNTSFNVTSNSPWTVTSDALWCTVPASGTGNGTLMATYTQNTAPGPRTANITVTVAGLTPVVVTVTQAGNAPTLTVTPPNQTVASPAGNVPFTVTTASAWTAVSDAAWCSVTPSGTGNGTITATYTLNGTTSTRIANITVTVTGLSPVVVTVTQTASTPTLTVTPPNQTVTTVAGSTSFAVTSNMSWTVVSDALWCTVNPSGTGNGTITANYTQNVSPASRVANITVSASGLAPVIVTVSQAGSMPTLTVTPPYQNVEPPAGTISYTVTSNSTWIVSTTATWFTVTPSGFGNGTIVANYSANQSVSPRSDSIKVMVAGLQPVIVLLSQAGAVPTLSVTPPNQNVPGVSGVTQFTVTSNAPWTVSSSAAWCTFTPSGVGNGQITVNYEINPLLTPRVANISVSANGITPVNVTVSQAGGAPTLSIDPHNQNVDFHSGTVVYNVSSNSAWTASCDMPWCTINGSGNGNGTITANYQANPDAADRIATITVTVAGMAPATATLTQAAAPATLLVTPQIQNVTMPAGTTTFNVTSNASWNAGSDVSWCNTTPFGTGNGVINAYYNENTTPVIRTANITVSAAGVSPQTVKVIQLPSFVSIGEQPQSGIQVFPNPTNGIFVISSPSQAVMQLNVAILDISGKILMTRECSGESSYTFDLTRFAKGNYYVKAELNGKTMVWKMILK
ncbi:MAG: T9SS type A sorting domain-containing protein [Bacteroidetes bacterium]|nr:T9SS type A sorting domain-containing protein [Bacteroidota bacterium]